MKVICVSNKAFERLPLTIGKMYDVIRKVHTPFSRSPFYLVKCDNGEEKSFEANRFRELTLDEKREIKLNDILN